MKLPGAFKEIGLEGSVQNNILTLRQYDKKIVLIKDKNRPCYIHGRLLINKEDREFFHLKIPPIEIPFPYKDLEGLMVATSY